MITMMSCSAMADSMNAKKVYPGKWIEKEKNAMEAFLAENEAINNRGEIDLEALKRGALPEDTPGFAGSWTVTEEFAKDRASLYDVNPLYFDSKYAQKSGFKDIICYPSIGCRDDSFLRAIPKDAMDGFAPTDLNHTNTFLKPIYPGDTLYYIIDKRNLTDMTPSGGASFRAVALNNEGRIINQNGEVVNEVVYRVVENLKHFIDPDGEKPFDPGHHPKQSSSAPEEPYNDEDWELIMSQWKAEVKRGSDYLYWEDVNVGDMPVPTLLGPFYRKPGPSRELCGIGSGGKRPLKEELMDPELLKTLVRDSDGLYKLPGDDDDSEKSMIPGAGGANFNTRDVAIRHITDWCGDHGWLKSISWCAILIPEAMIPSWPMNPKRVSFISPDAYPGKKSNITDKNRKYDCTRVRSWVTKKYYEDGEYLVELAWFVEDFNGNPDMPGSAIVRLPSRSV